MEYLSKERYDQLMAELEEMIKVELPAVKDEIAEARDKGDLSENFEYHAAKRKQGKLLGRIRFKQRVLQYARVMDTSNLDADVVGLFRKVEITNVANNARMAYTIVNPHEADLRERKISIKSPIAQALVGKKVGDVVEAQVPAGTMKFKIESISVC
ncbi:MAG: transcription elongation factor GreA [Bacteroidales bacterium]|nr:transcription elongation factor GreA [Bacteroidales bacterium]